MIQHAPSTTFHSFACEAVRAEVAISRFRGASGVEEYHLMVRPTQYASIATQLDWTLEAYQSALDSAGIGLDTCVLRRFFCSDLANQIAVLDAHRLGRSPSTGLRTGLVLPDELAVPSPCAVSWVCQPPISPAKVALWAYHVKDSGSLDKSKDGPSLLLRRGELTHAWTSGVACPSSGSAYDQTEGIFDEYNGHLRAQGMNLADHVMRTWFFVRDVDTNYQGMVAARREVFARQGLTPDTHFIASTGVEGSSADAAALVHMDAYAISGVRPEQIEFLCAPEHLSPTHIYGVTFERGVSVAYQDRKHVIISGTASIDHAGAIVHPGHVLRQLDRTLENIEALLERADAGFQDVCVFIVYVRDPSDLDIARAVMSERFGDAPVQVVVAPVCRPGWLIEIECQAIVPASNPTLPAF